MYGMIGNSERRPHAMLGLTAIADGRYKSVPLARHAAKQHSVLCCGWRSP